MEEKMSNSRSPHEGRRVENAVEYCKLKEVRANTALIGGKIIYEGKVWESDIYEAAFPPPVLRYKGLQLDGRAVSE